MRETQVQIPLDAHLKVDLRIKIPLAQKVGFDSKKERSTCENVLKYK